MEFEADALAAMFQESTLNKTEIGQFLNMKYAIGQNSMHPINVVNLKFCEIPDKKPKKPYAFKDDMSITFNTTIGIRYTRTLSSKLSPWLLMQAPSSRYLTLLNLVSTYGVMVKTQARHNKLPICTDASTVSKIPKYTTKF